MSDARILPTHGSTAALPAVEAQRNRVLRNTYWLLALSMVPTIVGAWLGVSTGLLRGISPVMGAVVFLAGAFGFMYAIERTKESSAGVVLLLAFTFFMGLMLSRMLSIVLGMAGGAQLVMLAFGATGTVFLAMAMASSVIKRDLSSFGRWLFVGAVLVLVAGLANLFIQSSALMLTVASLVAVIFSGFILYELKSVRDGTQTNYVSATLGVYLAVYNVFQALLALLGIGGSDD